MSSNPSITDTTGTGLTNPNPYPQIGTESALSSYVGPYVTEMLGRGQGLASMPFEAYEGPLTAGPSYLQTKAFEGLGSINVPTGEMGAFTPQTFTGGIATQYMNPFLEAALAPQLREARRQSDISALADRSRLTKAGAFGGARQGVEQANLAGAQAQAVGASLAQGYGQAQQMAMSDFANQQQRLQQGARLAAGLGQQQQQQQAADVTGLLQTGTLQQQREQMEKDAQFKQQMAQIYEPYQRVGFVSDIFQGSPTSASSLTMSTAPGTNPLAQAVGAGITGLAAYQGFANQGK